ncbi:hypothetical protein TNCV_4559441 [Trichonephila clavipes]|nr:hypothetical protein TNCV_4559441 [Trichonephila clavipes]
MTSTYNETHLEVSDADCCCAVGAWRQIPQEAFIFVNEECLCSMGGTLNSCQGTRLFVRLVEREDSYVAPDHPQDVLPKNWGGIEPNSAVTSATDSFCVKEKTSCG